MNRNIVNFAMTLCILAVMDYRFTANAIHEILGVLVVLLIIIHNVLNRRWYITIAKGKMNLLRMLNTATNLLMLAMMLLVTVTGVLISQTVFSAVSLSGHLWIHELHTFSAYLSFILCSIHIGFHWNSLSVKLCRWLGIDAENSRTVLLGRISSLLVIGYGIHASLSRQIGAKLLFQHVFGGWGAKPPLTGFVLDYLAILGCYAVITNYMARILYKTKS